MASPLNAVPLPNTVDPAANSIHRMSNGHFYAGPPDAATATNYASLCDIIIQRPGTLHPFLEAMYAGNNGIILAEYDKSIQLLKSATGFPEKWYAHTSTNLTAANRITVFGSYYEMKADEQVATAYKDSRGFTATRWREWVSQDHWYKVNAANAGTTHGPQNAIYFDSMSQYIGPPVDPSTGTVIPQATWRAITYTVGDQGLSRKPVANSWVLGNGIQSGPNFMGTAVLPAAPNGATSGLLPHIDVCIAESFLRSNAEIITNWPTDRELEQSIDMLKYAAISGNGVIASCPINNATAGGSGFVATPATAAQIMQWRRLSMCTYLIGNDGLCWYEFVESDSVLPWNEDHPYYHVKLGAPIDHLANGAAYKDGTTGLYTRDFAQGSVFVNNTGSPVTFNPGTGFKEVDGTVITGTITIGANDGRIILGVNSPGPGGGSYSNVLTDLYERTVAAGGLGTADTGQSYTLQGTATNYSTDGHRAVVAVPLNAGRSATPSGIAFQDMHSLGLFQISKLPAGDSFVFYVWARRSADGQNGYRVRCEYTSGGVLQMRTQKVVANAVTNIGTLTTVDAAASIGTVYAAEIQAVGVNPTQVQASVYKASGSAPLKWMNDNSDSEATLQVATLGGGWSTFIQALATNAPINLYVPEFYIDQVTSGPAPKTPPDIQLVSPLDGDTFKIASGATTTTINAQVTATDTDGAVQSVTVAVNGGSPQLATASGNTWSKSLKLAAGTYTLQWVATDNDGLTTVVNESISVSASVTGTKAYVGHYGADTGGGFAESIALDSQTQGQYSLGGDTWGLRVTTIYGNEWQGSMGKLAGRLHGRATFFSKRHATKGVRFYGHGTNGSGGALYYGLPGSLMMTKLGTDDFSLSVGSGSGANNWVRRACGQHIDSWYKSSNDTEYMFTVTRRGLSMYKNDSTVSGVANMINAMGSGVVLCGTTAPPGGINNEMRQFVEVIDATRLIVINSIWHDTGSAFSQINVQVFVVSTSASDWSGATAANTTASLQTVPTTDKAVFEIHKGKDGVWYAACGRDGVYTVTISGTTLSWTHISQQGGSEFFDRVVTSVDACSDGTVFAGQGSSATGNSYDGSSGPTGMPLGHSVAKRTGGTWAFAAAPANVHFNEFQPGDGATGSGPLMWIRGENTMLGQAAHDVAMIRVDPHNDNYVVLCGRAGCWQSRDKANNWYPAMYGVNGGQTINAPAGVSHYLSVSGNTVDGYNTDYGGYHSTDSLKTAVEQNYTADSGSAGHNVSGLAAGASLSWTGVDGATYVFTAPGSGTPATLKKNGVFIHDEAFQGAIVLPTAVAASLDGTVYVLQDGGGTFCMRFEDTGGGGGGGSDTTPPTLTVGTPSANATVPNGTTTQAVSGTATDNVAVNAVTVNGVAQTLDGSGNFSTSVALAVGSNTITIIATDAAGNATTITRTITRSAPTNNPPTVAISAPTAGQTFASGTTSVTLSGTASDDVSVASLSYKLDGGAAINLTLTAGAFSASVPVGVGAHSIVVTATDGGGLSTSATVNFTVSGAAGDTTPPTLNVTTPSGDTTVPNTTTSQTIAGTVSDNVAVASVTINGTNVAFTGGNFSLPIGLGVGSNQFTIVATDTSGNKTTVVRTVTRQAAGTAPSLVVSSPVNNQSFTDDTQAFILSGTATDADGTVTSVTYSVDGAAPVGLVLSSGAFSTSVSLPTPDGTHTITVVATDNSGLTTTNTININITAAGVTVVIDTVPRLAEFVVVLSTHDGTLVGELKGTDLRFGRYIGQPGFISFDIDRSHPMAPIIYSEPSKFDWSLQRNGLEFLAGELVSRDADTDTNAVSYTGTDWMAYLDQLVLPFDPDNIQNSDNFTKIGADLTDIAQGLISKVLSQYPNTIDIAYNNDPTGIVQDQHFAATDLNSLKSMLDQLAQQTPGFEWEITHDRQFVMYAPRRVDTNSYRVDSSNIQQVHYGLQGVPATTVYGRGTGSSSAQAIKKATSASCSAKYRDRVVIQDFGTITTRSVLQQVTNSKLGELAKQKLEFWITLQPDPADDIWNTVFPGQYLTVDYDDGFIQLKGQYRLAGYEGYVNEQGDEQAVFNFNTDDITADGG